jgi:two-component system sporulation sensor kinase A
MEEQNASNHKWVESLRQSEERYRTLVELSAEGVLVYKGESGVVIFMNQAGLGIVGASKPEEVLGRPVFDFVHPDDRQFTMDRARYRSGGHKGSESRRRQYIY